MTNRYVVWSAHIIEGREEPLNVAEVSRTDRDVAQTDAAIFREIFYRKSWVQDNQNKPV